MAPIYKTIAIVCCIIIVIAIQVKAKTLEDAGNTSLADVGSEGEMMETAESQNPFLPRFAMKKLKERREQARAQKRNGQATKAFLLLTLGVIGARADLISKQTDPVAVKETTLLFIDNDSQTTHVDETSTNTHTEHCPLSDGDDSNVKEIYRDGDATADNVIQTTIVTDQVNEMVKQLDNDKYLEGLSPSVKDSLYSNVFTDNEPETMELAASLPPIPIFRKRKLKPTRRLAIRKNYRKNPYSSYRGRFVYYPYYSFYYPSSFRYFY